MSPAVHGEAVDIARWIEAGAAQHSSQLVAYIALERRKRGAQQLGPSRPVLIACGQSRLGRKGVAAQAYGKIEPGVYVIASRGLNLPHSEFLKRRPVPDGDMRVYQWHIHQVGEGFLLFLRQ